MRAAIAAVCAVVVLAGSAATVARSADNTDGERRARMIAVLGDNAGPDCGCTAGIRAKERVESGLAGDPNAADTAP